MATPSALRLPLCARLASTTGVGNGKIHQVSASYMSRGQAELSRSVLASLCLGWELTELTTLGHRCRRRWFVAHPHGFSRPCHSLNPCSPSRTVKFDGAKLPPILNALTTDNQGNKLTLEVAVGSTPSSQHRLLETNRLKSNIWVRMSSVALPWMVSWHQIHQSSRPRLTFCSRYRGSHSRCQGHRHGRSHHNSRRSRHAWPYHERHW